MTLRLLSIGTLALSTTLASAQDAAAPAAAAGEIDIGARKRSVVELEAHIADRQTRLNEITADIIRLDERVESRVDKIVEKLKTMTDSKDSQVRVAQTKKDAVEGLKKMIEYYVKKRDGLEALIKGGGTAVSADELAGDKAAFDERIEKRVAQVIDLSRSFAEFEEIEKYDKSTQSAWGWSWTNYSINDDWRHNRKSVRHTDAQKKEIEEALVASIERLERRGVELRKSLAATGLTDGQKEILEADIANNEAMVSRRQLQIEELHSEGAAGTDRVSRNEADRVRRAIEDQAKDLRDDFFAIFEKYAEFGNERERIAGLRANLEARKKWLADYEKAGAEK